MTVGLQFTPLYGGDGGEAICCLLRIGGVSILLDCGWDEQFNTELLQPVLNVLPQLDLVLLSQPDLKHLGALPYLVGKAGLKAPVYAATPIARLGLIFYHDCYASQQAGSEFTRFDPENIDAAFDRIKTLKHRQLVELELHGLRFRLVGYPAGHMIGGTVWMVETGGEVVVYGPCTNHMKERHLRGGQLSSVPVRPALVVCGPGQQGRSAVQAAAGGSGQRGPLLRAARDAALLAALRDVFARGGNVLLPVDSSGRMLEVLLLLDHLWYQHKFVYRLGLLSFVADSAVRAAAGLIEWMSEELQREFNTSAQNPLVCKHVVRCHNVDDVFRLGEGPKVVLATGLSLDHGLSRQLMVNWATDSRNAVIFTQPPPPGSLGDQLLCAGAGRPLPLSLVIGRREPLTGLELQEYEAKRAEAEAAAAEEAAAAATGNGGDADGLLPLRESSGAIRQLKRSATGALEQVLGDNAFDGFEEVAVVDESVLMDGFAPPPGATYCMFPDEQEALLTEWDAYGAVMDTNGLRQDEAEMELGGVLPDDEELDLEEVGPTKVVTDTLQLQFAASVLFLEGFAGLSDAASLATILTGIAPRSLLLLGANAADTTHLAQICASKLSKQQTKVIQPASGQEVSLRLASSYRVCINQQLLDSLSRHTVGIYEVAWLDGMLAAALNAAGSNSDAAAGDGGGAGVGQEGGTAPHADDAATGTDQQQPQAQRKVHWLDQEQLLMLVPPAAIGPAVATDAAGLSCSMDLDAAGSVVSQAALPTPAAAAAAANGHAEGPAGGSQQGDAASAASAAADQAVGDHGGIFIGDVKLSEVKQALASAGIPSQFSAGRLLVRGRLLVSRQGDDGQLMVEGPLCDDYFKVRDVVYSLYNVC